MKNYKKIHDQLNHMLYNHFSSSPEWANELSVKYDENGVVISAKHLRLNAIMLVDIGEIAKGCDINISRSGAKFKMMITKS